MRDLKEKELVDLEVEIVAFKTLEREGAMAIDTTAATDTIDTNPVLR